MPLGGGTQTPVVLEKQLVVNHLENIRGICTKTGLVRTLKQYYKDRSDASKWHNYITIDAASNFIWLR